MERFRFHSQRSISVRPAARPVLRSGWWQGVNGEMILVITIKIISHYSLSLLSIRCSSYCRQEARKVKIGVVELSRTGVASHHAFIRAKDESEGAKQSSFCCLVPPVDRLNWFV
jgi:hypothetical protein